MRAVAIRASGKTIFKRSFKRSFVAVIGDVAGRFSDAAKQSV
jgi:hypothetical protein